jgi:glycosyltransferase involved in cell wall biosynthesis
MGTCLPTVLTQTHKNIEVIVVVHNCADNTWQRLAVLGDDRLKPWPLTSPKHYPDTPENRWFAGPVDPINLGLCKARGKWIARIDDDDQWTPTHLEDSIAAAKKRNLEFISAAHETHEDRVSPYWLDTHTKVGGTQTWLYRSYLSFFKYNRHCWRKSINRVNDTDIQSRMHRAGVRMGYLDDVHAKVLPRPGETEIGLKAYINKG